MLSTHLSPLLGKVAGQLLKDECTSQGPEYAGHPAIPPVLFQVDSFSYYKFLGQGSQGAFEVVHAALSSVGINRIPPAAVLVVVGMQALFVKRNFRHSVLPFSDLRAFELASSATSPTP